MTTIKRQRMTASSLDRFKKAVVGNDTYVLGDIQAHVMQRLSESDLNRRSEVLHPSDMSKPEWCYRHDYYRIIGVEPTDKVANPSFFMKNIFEEGHEIHRKWQRWLWEMGYLWGVFECRDCYHRWWDLSPRRCMACGKERLRYQEVPMETRLVAGHSDGGIIKPGAVPSLLEVKSVSLGTLRFEAPSLYELYQQGVGIDKIWWQIQRPFPSHLRQGLIYLWLANEGALSNILLEVLPEPPKQIVFIYEWKPTQSVKEFVVKYTPRPLTRVLKGVSLVGEAIDRGKPPPRPDWAEDEDSPVCRSCPYRSVCYHLSVPYDANSPAQAPTLQVQRSKSGVRRRALARPPWASSASP